MSQGSGEETDDDTNNTPFRDGVCDECAAYVNTRDGTMIECDTCGDVGCFEHGYECPKCNRGHCYRCHHRCHGPPDDFCETKMCDHGCDVVDLCENCLEVAMCVKHRDPEREMTEWCPQCRPQYYSEEEGEYIKGDAD